MKSEGPSKKTVDSFLNEQGLERPIYIRNKLIPIVYALVGTNPNVSHDLVYNHLLTNRYVSYQEDEKIINLMDKNFVPEDHEAILADFSERIKHVSIDFETFEVTIDYENLILDYGIFSDLTSRMIASFL